MEENRVKISHGLKGRIKTIYSGGTETRNGSVVVADAAGLTDMFLMFADVNKQKLNLFSDCIFIILH